MSLDMPNWGFLTVMIGVRRQLFKRGWRQDPSGRLDCIEKRFGDVIVRTIGAGDHLLLNVQLIENPLQYVPLTHPAIQEAKKELEPVIERVAKRNRKKFDQEIREYEQAHGMVFVRNQKYGV